MKKRLSTRPKIGIEIEVNDGSLTNDAIDTKIWGTKSEHCGIELVSKPAEGAKEIRSIARSIRKMKKDGYLYGFHNAGTHIHIDFIRDGDVDPNKDLLRLTARKAGDVYDNPSGNGSRYFWISEGGEIFSKPKEYLKKYGICKGLTPADIFYSESHPEILECVKRFFVLCVRFADTLFGIQHPDRRFNKYAHTIGDWQEEDVWAANSISEIAKGSRLGANHRRLMVNPLAFRKFGTIEIRMLKASLDWRELFSQIVLFTKMAKLAKSDVSLPKVGTTDASTLINLLDACEIHGKQRRNLLQMFDKNMSQRSFQAICFNFNCLFTGSSKLFKDCGLSRGLCQNCVASYWHCAGCGVRDHVDYIPPFLYSLDRVLCGACEYSGLISKYERDGAFYHLGNLIYKGLDSSGNPTRLKELHDKFG